MMRKIALLFLFLAVCSTARGQTPNNNNPAQLDAAGTSTVFTTSSAAWAQVGSNNGAFGIGIAGTWTGTISFFGSVGNQPLVAINATPSNSTTAVTTTTANGVWTVGVAGYNVIYVVFTTYGSGVAQVAITPSNGLNSGAGGGATGSVAFSAVTPGTNTGALLIGTGGSLGTTGTGTIAATSVPFSGITGGTNATAAMICGTGCSLSSVPQFNIGAVGTAGVLGLAGATSGTATFTAPAVAGTTSNPVLMSNVIEGPAGSAGAPTFEVGVGNSGLFSAGSSGVSLAVGGVEAIRFFTSNAANISSTFNLGWESTSALNGAVDSNISRISAGILGIGTGTQGAITGTLENAMSVSIGGAACANGNFTLSAGWGSTASVSGAVGFSQTCEITITSNGTGQAAGATITWTLPTPMPTATTACTANLTGGSITGLSGTGILIDQTTLSATAPVFTFAGLPVTTLTTKFVFRCGP
jgi:hypothetical protein